MKQERAPWGGYRSYAVKILRDISTDEDQYIRDWWSKRLTQEYKDTITDQREWTDKVVYIDHYPDAPESVYRDDIGHGEYTGYVVVPAGDRANPSRDRIRSSDVAVPASMLSAADVTRLRKLAAKSAPKKPRARR